MLSLKIKMQNFLGVEIKINCILTVGKKIKIINYNPYTSL